MNMDEFKERYEELKNNPMYQKYCSVLETKDKIIKKLSSQLEQKEDNWNKLKEWLEEYIENIKMQYQNSEPIRQYSLQVIIDTLQVTIDKMQEIEGGMNE